MPLIDKPIEELLTYTGCSPCPDDIDEFWDARLEELSKHNPVPTFTKSDFECDCADCFDLYFTGTKNAKIYAKYLRPKNIKGKAPAILHFHGYSGSCGDWTDFISYAAEGFCVAALDCRGQGGLSEDVGGYGGSTYDGMFVRGIQGPTQDMLFVQQYLDTALLARIVMGCDEVDEERVAVKGGSQGGGLSLACASLVPEIKLAAVWYPFLADFKRVWDMDLDKDAYKEIKYYFTKFDPRHEREKEFFTKLGYIDTQNLVKRIRARVLMSTGLMDTVVPPSTQFAAYNKITSKKEYILYPDLGHEYFPQQPDIDFKFLRELKK